MEASSTEEARATTTGTGTIDRGWLPTRKWFAALITGLLTIAGQALASGGWDNPEWAQVLTLASALVGSYLVPNASTPGGVPDAKVS